jgi:hypothetical protein
MLASHRVSRSLLFFVLLCLAAPLLFAQQTGSISGRVTGSDGSALPGVTVEARSNVLPQPRVTTTDETGEYRLPELIPGTYTLTYTLAGLQTATRRADVQLAGDTTVNAAMGMAGVAEEITVTAMTTLVNRESTALQSGMNAEQITQLPVTQNYSDLQKFIPGVSYNPDTLRGPSAGASGQDNIYMFDGVNITMPLFGILNSNTSDPNTHDIAQVTVIRGGAKAIDFNRAGGFLIDTVTKSGTNEFTGELSYEALNKNFIADQSGTQVLTYQQDRSWASANLGGPIIGDRLFFYGSYYRPKFTRDNQANVYGDLPSYTLDRTDWFGKLTYTPLASVLLNGSYRDSSTDESPSQFTQIQAATTGTGSQNTVKIGTLEGSWIVNPKSFATAKVYDYRNPGFGVASDVSAAVPAFTNGTHLDIANLANQGRLILPTPLGNNAAQNAFVAPFINQYGYICPANGAAALGCIPGQVTGGGTVGAGQFSRDDDSFFRKAGQAGYNYTLGSRVTHDLHVGYLHQEDSEDRFQLSNGWGAITIPAGVGTAGTCPASVCGTATPAFFVAQVSQQGARGVPTIHSEVKSENVEFNDTIHMGNWSFNAGVLASQDTLYGQGLARADNVAGYIASAGTKYEMHKFGFSEMIQPRLGATWAYNGSDTVWVSAARYMPPANSDARAASWDRNLVAQLNVYFDAAGNEIGIQPNASSSGKWWQDDIKHPEIKEYMIGTSRQFTPAWATRVYARYRKGDDFIEDTNNNARSAFGANIPGLNQALYVPNLGTVSPRTGILGAIGSGSSYVIANLDGAFTKYYEATAESEWHNKNLTLNGSYTWSHYYGNFDQDNTTFNDANDAATFIGSSNIGDGAGRQLWDFKYGDLRGDRRHSAKMTGIYTVPWNATIGAFALYQSGQPYQLESVLPYRPLTGSTSDTNRYAEPAGARKSPSHHQLDLNYTQNVPLPRKMNFQVTLAVFNALDTQTPYNYETRIGTLGFTSDKSVAQVEIPNSISDATLKALLAPTAATFNRADWGVKAPTAKSFYAPRRFQLTARFQF